MPDKTFQNPILSGFYPDPSICRVGEDYYMVTSSFVYFPGLPIFHSKDLVHWEQIGHGIYLCELDPETFRFAGERRVIWDGNLSRSKWIEAPHLYYENGFYYLMVAEGGTFTNHSVMMARCETIDGTYEICPRNPVITHRHLSLEREISVVGHGDLVETQNGEWWMVLLGVRPTQGTHFNLGRETFLIPVVWETDGWLRADNDNGLVNKTERCPALPLYHAKPEFSSDNFESPVLHQRWNTIHPASIPFWSLTGRPGCLRLFLRPEKLSEICTPAFIGRRQQHRDFRLQTAMDFTPAAPGEEAGLALIQDDRYHYRFTVSASGQPGIRMLVLTECRNHKETVLRTAEISFSGRIYLTVTGTQEGYHFYYGENDQMTKELYLRADSTLLSSLTNEGFTGTYLGMYGSSNHTATENHADFDWFLYEGIR